AFFNELDLLEIRLHELDEIVDQFILVEATRTFQKQPKPLYFQENRERFAPFLDKIVHIVVDEYPHFFKKFRVPTFWDYDNHQKEFMLRGLKKVQAKPEDTIIISDLDEIPKLSKILAFKDIPGYKVFEQRFYFYYLNGLCTFYDTKDPVRNEKYNHHGLGYWRGPIMLSYQELIQERKTIKKTRILRGEEGKKITIVPEGGWHFSFMGGLDKIIHKINNWAHGEFNTAENNDPGYLKKLIEAGKDMMGTETQFTFVALDDTFPQYLLQNVEKYKHLIKPITTLT
ncbi:MAG: hypothetical protein AAF734_08385, partial [Bacteroidota bacterium]